MKTALLILSLAELVFSALVICVLARSLATMCKRICGGRNKRHG